MVATNNLKRDLRRLARLCRFRATVSILSTIDDDQVPSDALGHWRAAELSYRASSCRDALLVMGAAAPQCVWVREPVMNHTLQNILATNDSRSIKCDVERCAEAYRQVITAQDALDLKTVCYAITLSMTYRALAGALVGEVVNRKLVIRGLLALLAIDTIDSNELVEKLYEPEKELERDPAGLYVAMTNESKWQYRKSLDSLAGTVGVHAIDLVRKANAMAARASDERRHNGKRHNGYYILGCGVAALLKDANGGTNFREGRHGQAAHNGRRVVALLLVAGAGCLATTIAFRLPAITFPLLWLLASESVIFLFHQTVRLDERQGMLPAIDMEIPGAPTVMVTIAVPVLLRPTLDIHRMLERLVAGLEVPASITLTIAVLSDWQEANHEAPDDQEVKLLADAKEAITKIVESSPRRHSVCLLHRGRRLSRTQNAWHGWEKKRGKIIDLVRSINSEEFRFSESFGDADKLKDSNCILILDEDSVPSCGCVSQLVGAWCHPNNKPTIDSTSGIVEEGYGIIAVPEVVRVESPGLLACWDFLIGKSVRSFQGQSRNPWFDCYGVRTFSGKGLVDVLAATCTIWSELPEETILSHDVLEGGILRTGHCPGAAVYQLAPQSYSSIVKRWHRWVRGDVQNALLVLSATIRRECDAPARRALVASRWFALEKSRHDLVCVAQAALVILLAIGDHPASALLALTWPSWIEVVASALQAMTTRKDRVRVIEGVNVETMRRAVSRELLRCLTCLHMALVTVDAVVRSTIRFARSKKLLEWVSAGDSNNLRPGDLVNVWLLASALGSLVAICVGLATRTHFLSLVPFVLWAFTPVIVPLWYSNNRTGAGKWNVNAA